MKSSKVESNRCNFEKEDVVELVKTWVKIEKQQRKMDRLRQKMNDLTGRVKDSTMKYDDWEESIRKRFRENLSIDNTINGKYRKQTSTPYAPKNSSSQRVTIQKYLSLKDRKFKKELQAREHEEATEMDQDVEASEIAQYEEASEIAQYEEATAIAEESVKVANSTLDWKGGEFAWIKFTKRSKAVPGFILTSPNGTRMARSITLTSTLSRRTFGFFVANDRISEKLKSKSFKTALHVFNAFHDTSFE